MKRICLVGTGPKSREDAPYHDHTVHIWTIARGRFIPPRVDRLFEMHVPDLWDGWSDKRATELYADALKTWDGCPIYMQEAYEDVPKAVKFPKDDVLKVVTPYELGATEPYQTSQVSWQLALAIYEIFTPSKTAEFYQRWDDGGGCVPYGEIMLYGYDLISEGESRSHQRHAVEYYIAMARGMGIKVTIAEKSTLCAHRRDGEAILYGYDYPLTRSEAIHIYGHPMRQILSDKDGKPVEIRTVPGVLGFPMIGAQGDVKMEMCKVDPKGNISPDDQKKFQAAEDPNAQR